MARSTSTRSIQVLPLNNVNGVNELTRLVPNPFFGVDGAGAFATRATIQRNQLLRPFPQFDSVNMIYSTLARSQYHAGVIQLTKRASGWWGGRFSYTYSRLNDNQFAQSNYYSDTPGGGVPLILNNYTAIPWSEYFDPDAEYGRSRLDSPHKLVASPIIRLPFGAGQRWLTSGVGSWLAGGWTISAVIQMQSGFPIGVYQNVNNNNLLGAAQRPNLVSGIDVEIPGSITDRLRGNPDDDTEWCKKGDAVLIVAGRPRRLWRRAWARCERRLRGAKSLSPKMFTSPCG